MRLVVTRRLLGLAVVALTTALCGCDTRPKFVVTGTVTYNGAPLNKPDGQILFVGPDGTQVAAPISPDDGTYKAVDVLGGANRIAVTYKNPAFAPAGRPKGVPGPKDRPVISSPSLVPDKYTNVETSKLSVDVKEGTTFNVDMTGPKIP